MYVFTIVVAEVCHSCNTEYIYIFQTDIRFVSRVIYSCSNTAALQFYSILFSQGPWFSHVLWYGIIQIDQGMCDVEEGEVLF